MLIINIFLNIFEKIINKLIFFLIIEENESRDEEIAKKATDILCGLMSVLLKKFLFIILTGKIYF